MRLKATPFAQIVSGKKTIEARIYDEKRKHVELGDTIVFTLVDDATQKVETKVIGLLRYETFGEMFAHTDVTKFGGEDAKSLAREMLLYYDQDEQDANGVIGIEFSIAS